MLRLLGPRKGSRIGPRTGPAAPSWRLGRHRAAPVQTAVLRHARRLLCVRLAGLAAEPDACVARAWAETVAEVEALLRHEEIIMQACRCVRLHEQLRENATVLAALHRSLPRVESGDLALARQLTAALLDVLSLHRITAGLAIQPPAAAGARRGRPGARASALLGGGRRRNWHA